MRLLIAISFITLAASASTAWGQTLYRCKQGGQTIFSERPCGKSAQTVDIPGYVAEPLDKPVSKIAPKPEEKPEIKAAEKPATPTEARPPVLSEVERGELLAKRCVDKYRPHLAYPNGVKINGHRLQRDGFGETIFVEVRTITNPNTPARIDPITLSETFICRTNGQDGIDDRYTEDYVERHKRGIRTDVQ